MLLLYAGPHTWVTLCNPLDHRWRGMVTLNCRLLLPSREGVLLVPRHRFSWTRNARLPVRYYNSDVSCLETTCLHACIEHCLICSVAVTNHCQPGRECPTYPHYLGSWALVPIETVDDGIGNLAKIVQSINSPHGMFPVILRV